MSDAGRASTVAGVALPDRLADSAADVERALRAELDGWLVDAPARLSEAIRYAALGPGKRLRPVLVLWTAELASGGSPGPETVRLAMPAALAIELLHTYSLVHDDLPAMDDDDLRRGRPTCHKAFDEGTAILAGDALLTRAFDLLARADLPAGRRVRLAVELAGGGGTGGMIGGQAEDLAFQHVAGDLHAVERIHARKTAALLASACRMGPIAVGAARPAVDALGRFGRCLGLAFQIADDLLDETGQTEQVGKQVGKDRRAGKLTYVAVAGVEGARRAGRAWLDQAEAALAELGEPGRTGSTVADDLRALARYVIERTR